MPQITAAKKALRQNATKRAINDRWRRKAHEAIHAVQRAISTADKKAAIKAYQVAQSVIDRTARRNIIHKNQAARQKSRLQRDIAAIDEK